MLLSHHILGMRFFCFFLNYGYFDFKPCDSAREIDYASFVASSGLPNTLQTFLSLMVVLFPSCLGTFMLADVCEIWRTKKSNAVNVLFFVCYIASGVFVCVIEACIDACMLVGLCYADLVDPDSS